MRHRWRRAFPLAGVLLVVAAGSAGGQTSRTVGGRAPDAAGYDESPHQLRPAVEVSPNGMVVAGTEAAARVGAEILERGGNAVDAAVAVAFALGVTEPMSSGLGGQTFILLLRGDGRAVAIDGSCRVPGRVNTAELVAARASAEAHYIQGHRAVAVPGTVAALTHALDRYGTMSLDEVIQPAVDLAEFGYRLSSTAVAEIEIVASWLHFQEYVASMFLDVRGEVRGPGHLYCASDLASTLRAVARLGPDEFYRGEIAREIEADMVRHGGYVRAADLALVRATEVEPLRDRYRQLEVLSFPTPGGGGSLFEMLHILETFPPALLAGDSVDRLHLLIEAARIVKADAESDTLPVAIRDYWLRDRRRAAERARLIRFDRALREAEITQQGPVPYRALGTTQVSVADRHGTVVSLAQTVGAFFGSDVATPGLGFVYNANLNAFDFSNPRSPRFVAPGPAPQTTMTPTIVLAGGKPILVLGSAGSDRIVPAIAAVVSAVADRGLGACEAVASPRALWGASWGDARPWVELAEEITAAKADVLEARGFADLFRLGFPAPWFDMSIFGGTNVVAIDHGSGAFVGVPDPRRQGAARAPGRS